MTGSSHPVEPTCIATDESFYLEGPPRPEDACAHRRIALDPDAARHLGWTIEQAESQPDSYYARSSSGSCRGGRLDQFSTSAFAVVRTTKLWAPLS